LENSVLNSLIKNELKEAEFVLNQFLENPNNISAIAKVAEVMSKAIRQGGKIISFGNGGSMSDAMHFAEELSGKYRNSRKALPAIAISDPGYLTCVANDFGFNNSFSRFIEAIGKKEDIVLGISTSGNSQNVINAIETAKSMDIISVSLTGKNGGILSQISDYNINVVGKEYADRIQEVHIKIIHCLIAAIEQLVLE